ncbi:MAG: sulfur oxidation c-type cytochrome SoxA [Alphaproteobacteria bacterium]|nr:MAG: sulfur oxidation c-type cytochrome SoxA [Alphaproteobacteria bacterium]
MNFRARTAAGLAVAALLAIAGAARAESNVDPNPGVELVINGDTPITVRAKAPDYLEGHLDNIYSGWLYRIESTRAMEADDFENPAITFVEEGIDAWNTVEGTEGKSCASCHGDISEGMKGVRARMPAVNENGELWSLEDYINNCRVNRMGAEPYKWDKGPMKNMTAAISMQSRGMPMNVAVDGPAAPFWERGRDMYYTRYGLLQLSCASCHEKNNNNYIRGDHLSQGQIVGFPTYRLKKGGLVSIHNRLKGCIRDTRAETFPIGSQELRELELYVASRGNGLSVEGVAVRP